MIRRFLVKMEIQVQKTTFEHFIMQQNRYFDGINEIKKGTAAISQVAAVLLQKREKRERKESV